MFRSFQKSDNWRKKKQRGLVYYFFLNVQNKIPSCYSVLNETGIKFYAITELCES